MPVRVKKKTEPDMPGPVAVYAWHRPDNSHSRLAYLLKTDAETAVLRMRSLSSTPTAVPDSWRRAVFTEIGY